ncbi:MAG TPA: hypothetical protein VK841_13795 [Polyangiaceae bacterium]|nr:hypothetical protein [Polyangiaceae bacterium]
MRTGAIVMGTALAATIGIFIAQGCGGPNCDCPADFVGPGWCQSEGPGTCQCRVSTLCPGWCLAYPGSIDPVPCTDGGQGDAD